MAHGIVKGGAAPPVDPVDARTLVHEKLHEGQMALRCRDRILDSHNVALRSGEEHGAACCEDVRVCRVKRYHIGVAVDALDRDDDRGSVRHVWMLTLFISLIISPLVGWWGSQAVWNVVTRNS
eukprot:877162-Prymnesium_polylepis.2